jgi:hypothetical protein
MTADLSSLGGNFGDTHDFQRSSRESSIMPTSSDDFTLLLAAGQNTEYDFTLDFLKTHMTISVENHNTKNSETSCRRDLPDSTLETLEVVTYPCND